MMNVKELREILKNVDDDVEIVIAKDGEGNDFSPLSGMATGEYQMITTWYGDFFGSEIIGDEDYGQPGPNTTKAICMWPVN